MFGLRKGVECYASSGVTYAAAARSACDAGCPPALAASWGPPQGGRPLQCGGINATSMYTLGEGLLASPSTVALAPCNGLTGWLICALW